MWTEDLIGPAVFATALAFVIFITTCVGPSARRVGYNAGLCHAHGGVQVEIYDTLACIRPPTAVRIEP